MTKKTKPAAKAAPKKNAVVIVDKVAEKAALVTKANNKLAPIAKEINARFEKIAKLEGDANDHRLSAAIRIAEAEKVCVEAGIKFAEWAVENIKEQKWETVRKLLYVGKSEDPKAALTDQRKANNERNKKHRAEKKAKATPKALPAPKPIDVVLSLKPEEQTALVEKVSKDLGLVVKTKSEVEADKQKTREQTAAPVTPAKKPTYSSVVEAIDELAASDQIKVLRYIAEKHLFKVTEPTPAEEMPELPDFLKKKG
jgi:hypothetical protein